MDKISYAHISKTACDSSLCYPVAERVAFRMLKAPFKPNISKSNMPIPKKFLIFWNFSLFWIRSPLSNSKILLNGRKKIGKKKSSQPSRRFFSIVLRRAIVIFSWLEQWRRCNSKSFFLTYLRDWIVERHFQALRATFLSRGILKQRFLHPLVHQPANM